MPTESPDSVVNIHQLVDRLTENIKALQNQNEELRAREMELQELQKYNNDCIDILGCSVDFYNKHFGANKPIFPPDTPDTEVPSLKSYPR